MATRKREEPQPLPVRNLVVIKWFDDEMNEHEYTIRLKRPKGREARQLMPKVLNFLAQISDFQSKLESNDLVGQSKLIDMFEEHEVLFPFILQIEGNKEALEILQSLVIVELMEPVFQAAQYIVSESLNRPEVQAALKKSDGDEPEVEAK